MQKPTEPSNKHLGAAGGPLFFGYLALIVLVGVIGVWSVQARIAGAVITSGMIQVENNRQVLQHPQGGVVGALLARDGDRVEAGDVVLRLDDKLLQSELAIIKNQLNELRARKGRLIAERDDAAEVTFDPLLLEADGDQGDLTLLMEGQERLFQARRLSLQQEAIQIENQMSQTRDQIEGSLAQLAASKSQTALLANELADVQSLFDKNADIISSKKTQQQFADYVAKQFLLQTLAGVNLPLIDVGYEVEGKFFWVYQEAVIPSALVGVKMFNGALRELWPTQINMVNIEGKGNVRTLYFSENEDWLVTKF